MPVKAAENFMAIITEPEPGVTLVSSAVVDDPVYGVTISTEVERTELFVSVSV